MRLGILTALAMTAIFGLILVGCGSERVDEAGDRAAAVSRPEPSPTPAPTPTAAVALELKLEVDAIPSRIQAPGPRRDLVGITGWHNTGPFTLEEQARPGGHDQVSGPSPATTASTPCPT